jgi:hypothetical protein
MALAVLGAISYAQNASAQPARSEAAPQATAPGAAGEPQVLPGLPRPVDVPSTLFQQPSPTKAYTCEPLPGPYLERSPLLDPPSLPPPGWFTGVDLGILGPHVKNRLTAIVGVDNRPPDIVHLPGANLDWTVAPRIELGRRLPSGFGEFALSYRFLATDGTESILGPDGPAALRSRLDLNVVDLDYASREFFTEQWPYCHMKWRFGLRYANVFFDSRSDQSVAAAAAGSGIFETRFSNHYWGIGPHAGLELTRHFESSGLALVSSIEGATLLGRISQNFFESSTSLGPTGQLLTGSTRETGSQSVPTINAFLGLRWQPPFANSNNQIRNPSFHVDLGLVYEYWWNVGRNSATPSRGELCDQGVIVRAEFNF